MLYRTYLALILFFVIGCGSSSEEKKVEPVKEDVAITDTSVPAIKEIYTSPIQVVVAPTKAPISIAVTKVIVVPTKPPVSAPTDVSNVEITPSPISGITPTSQPTTPPVVEVAKSSFSEGEPTVCTSGASIEEQKAVLTQIANAQFTGITAEGEPRMPFGADARIDRRRGGIWITVEFVGDELASTALKKTALDGQMREAYTALYTAGCEDLSLVDITAHQQATADTGSLRGNTCLGGRCDVTVFKTRLKHEVAETVDWSNRNNIDFNGIWETLILNRRWKQLLEGLEESD